MFFRGVNSHLAELLCLHFYTGFSITPYGRYRRGFGCPLAPFSLRSSDLERSFCYTSLKFVGAF